MEQFKHVYIAGPMSGLPCFNYPAFIEAAASLRSKGVSVISPHELDSPAVAIAAIQSHDGVMAEGKIAGETWGAILARDVETVADRVDSIAFLEGWENSRGAKLEATLGVLCGHKFYKYEKGGNLVPLGTNWVKEQISQHL